MVSLIWFAALGIGTVIYNLILAMILFGGNWLELFKEVFYMINSGVISITVTGILSSILTLILIYLSMALSKVTIKNKKNWWFMVYSIFDDKCSRWLYNL